MPAVLFRTAVHQAYRHAAEIQIGEHGLDITRCRQRLNLENGRWKAGKNNTLARTRHLRHHLTSALPSDHAQLRYIVFARDVQDSVIMPLVAVHSELVVIA